MDLVEFLSYRAMFAGLPYGELAAANQCANHGGSWTRTLLGTAKRMRTMAKSASRCGKRETAGQAWRWAACAYQAASSGVPVQREQEQVGSPGQINRLRQLARITYERALLLMPQWGIPVSIDVGTSRLNGYLRIASDDAPIVVLVNGLDSIAEVELHSFGDCLHARGMSTLALDLPASYTQRKRQPRYDVENIGPWIVEWISTNFPSAPSIGCFGVSFGGHLVARLLSGDSAFCAGVAASPPAFLGIRELGFERLRHMFCWTFDIKLEKAAEFARAIDIAALPPPSGALLIYHMDRDEVFGLEHIRNFQAWGGQAIHVRHLAAEHVGTSQIHRWLPEASDWLRGQLLRKGD